MVGYHSGLVNLLHCWDTWAVECLNMCLKVLGLMWIHKHTPAAYLSMSLSLSLSLSLSPSLLSLQLSNASSYDERSAIRKALRKVKGDGRGVKKTGSSVYRRAGFQAPTKVTIPNSVTGNVLPNKISMENPNKVETPQGAATISYLKSKESDKSSVSSSGRRSNTPTRSRVSSRTSTGHSPEPRVSEGGVVVGFKQGGERYKVWKERRGDGKREG